MMTSLAVTVIGKNQPGIINSLSIAAASHGANWLDSHLAEMAGQFAGIVHLEVQRANLDALKSDLLKLEQNGLSISLAEASTESASAGGRLLTLELVGQDHPGIVRDISEVLANNNINIEELETECVSGSMAGGTIFQASAVLSVPDKITNQALDELLQGVSEGLMVDVVLEESKQ